ncbi:ATP-dependent DNA helicase [Listeria cossartiae subsp. cayugensis]|uniref:ATP-dependent DNA helicase n=1 Tax=Listeria cossartiae subsp. cayugensis TaxID=2713505 RepID=A0ABU2IPC4_9LIST|nr:ATP-dependent DNA helicase [Listeria cossartiae]MDT0004228.1 ATP-dependent DNA helicase [Listeria cossartiae subsp. cayugensis]MDT0020622.1 ATP-dependent DNA helicase [Listeria cossartiae subsp. cayugensis]MDT0036163.1 ATP-dependent DNA helicase [Listeria cossartiae subsp. cayugensis]MDT0042373.1 ATP-dependent DNA helicase [Listeria cossartiae subsp. cayugensis]MDT0047724.1 ATP-dependent DNA helicase [Listeria cossartiae subsp. cayugensis]
MKKVQISVRRLVEFVQRSGSIDSRMTSSDRALEGTKIHQLLQKEAGEEYVAEVRLNLERVVDEIAFSLDGRADGIINAQTIDEIKTTETSMEEITEDFRPLHWAQLICYGFMLAEKSDLPEVTLQLTYYQVLDKEVKRFQRVMSRAEMGAFVDDLLSKYAVWAKAAAAWEMKRNKTIQALTFPYDSYRSGQRELAIAVYRTVSSEESLFCEAPTGIGKTMSTLFPGVKAMGEGKADKLFYFTAKTITRQVAEDALDEMRRKGLAARSVTITAKDKICFLDERKCEPDHCQFARGYYDRLNEGLFDMLQSEEAITRSVVEEYARKYTLCPFELSLDVALFCDVIICDYNYLFDPVVYLKRFFAEGPGKYTFLVDEVHNLVDRARSMYSATLRKSMVLQVKHGLDKKANKRLLNAINAMNKEMIGLNKKLTELGETIYVEKEKLTEWNEAVLKFTFVAKEWLPQNTQSESQADVLELYFESLRYLAIAEFYDERYVTQVTRSRGNLEIKQLCLDPAFLLSEKLKLGSSSVLFSATLRPIDYYTNVLGGEKDTSRMMFASPFKQKNMHLLVADYISTKYQMRETSLESVVDALYALTSGKTGNYLFFFPSFLYLQNVYDLFKEKYPNIRLQKQGNSMDEAQREHFLEEFQAGNEETLVGFCVLGGVFSEGVDLRGDRLVGAAIVGVGLAQLNHESDLIKDYYNKTIGRGFDYAYQIPGMNKVLQAVGRVIRGESDRGVVLLIEERFSANHYRALFPAHWNHAKTVKSTAEISQEVNGFWRNS